MMKNTIFGVGLLLLIFVFAQCEKETVIEYDLDQNNGEFIITGAITTDPQKSWVQIQNQIPALGNLEIEPRAIGNLDVRLCDNYGAEVDFEKTDSGYYYLPVDFNIEMGLKYSVRIEDDANNVIKSEAQQIPYQVCVDSAVSNKIEWDYMAYKYDITVYFADPDESDNYYRYDHYEYYSQEENPHIDNLTSVNYIFSDSLFNGEIADFRFYVNATKNGNKLDSILILLYTYSEDLYSLSESMLNYDGSILDTFSDFPSPIFSNIENAYGVFGAYNVDTFMVTIP